MQLCYSHGPIETLFTSQTLFTRNQADNRTRFNYLYEITHNDKCLGNPVDSLLIKIIKVLEKYQNICKLLFCL